jgi:hypothetical protein
VGTPRLTSSAARRVCTQVVFAEPQHGVTQISALKRSDTQSREFK